MPRLITLQNGSLPLPPELLEQLGVGENDPVLVDCFNGELTVKSLSRAELAHERLLAHLRLPVGALAHLIEQPSKPVTIEDELGGDIYDDID